MGDCKYLVIYFANQMVILALSSSICLAAPADNQFNSPEKIRQFSHMVSASEVKQLRAAIMAIPQRGDNAEIRKLWLAACDTTAGDYEQAVVIFDQAHNLHSAPDAILGCAADAYGQLQQFKKAIAIANTAISRGDNLQAYKARAACYSTCNQIDLAVADYDKLCTIDKPNAKRYLSKAGMLLNNAGKYEKALVYFTKASTADGSAASPTVWLARGICLEHLERWPEALACLSKAIDIARKTPESKAEKLSPGLCRSLIERAKCYDKLGKVNLANADRKESEKQTHEWEKDLLGK